MTDALGAVALLFARADVAYAVIGAHAVNAWLEPRLTADVDLTVQAGAEFQREVIRRAAGSGLHVATPEDLIVMKLIANRPKDRADLDGLVRLDAIDWAYVERWAAEWQVLELLHRVRAEAARS